MKDAFPCNTTWNICVEDHSRIGMAMDRFQLVTRSDPSDPILLGAGLIVFCQIWCGILNFDWLVLKEEPSFGCPKPLHRVS